MKCASKKLNGRGQNWSKMTTTKLLEILSHPHCIGSDGADYGPYMSELQDELWRRQAIEGETIIKRWDIDFKKQFNELRKLKKEKTA